MENTTMTNSTQITRVRFACPQTANRIFTVGVDGAFQGTVLSAFGFGAQGGFGHDLRISPAIPVPTTYAPMNKAFAVKDVASLRSWSPPV